MSRKKKSGPLGFGFLPDIRPTKYYGTERRVLDKNRLLEEYDGVKGALDLPDGLYQRKYLKTALIRTRPDWRKLTQKERDDLFEQAIDFIESEVGWSYEAGFQSGGIYDQG